MSDSKLAQLKEVYAFDFDGTLTTRDTLLEFIRFTHGTWGLLLGFLLHAPWLLAMKLRLYPNWKAKQRIFAYYYKGLEMRRFTELCRQFAKAKAALFRPQGAEKIRHALATGADVVVVSASVEDWVRPFFDEFVGNCASGASEESVVASPIRFECTRIEAQDGRLTGAFLTNNCYGTEKVRRIEALYPEREEYYLRAYGDSHGDYELLAFADEAFFKPFRK